jgi:hypothetical protein
MKKLARSTAMAASATLVGGVLMVTAAPANADPVFIIKLTEIETSSTDPQHNPPQVGDSISFASDLMQKGDRVGTDAGECVFKKLLGPAKHPTGAKVRCDVTFTFTTGTIHAVGSNRFHFNETSSTFAVPVVGGTGKFDNAKGHVTVHEVSDTKSRLKFRLRSFGH